MALLHSLVWIFSVGLMILGADMVAGQNFPSRPIRVLTSESGGGSDFAARLIAQGLTESLGQQVIVDNRAGIVSMELVPKAARDGYTLLYGGSALWILPFLRNDVHWDPVKDFAPITWAVTAPNVLVVHPSLPVKSVKDLIALAKAEPGVLNYGSASIGSAIYLAAELFKSMAGVNIVRIPYKGSGPLIINLIGGQVQFAFATAASVAPHIKSGTLRALAVTSAKPSALFPDLPTVAASGLPGYESVLVTGMFARARTPTALINRLSQETVRVLSRADVKEKFLSVGVETVGSSPEQFWATIKSEMSSMGKVIKDAGIRAE